ncbi:hypothetical protein N0V84_005043 [Fusarium piperis]|uniref:Uncharacterized protein n=1 Tax=Fusarium piperis TaxID=1435070 RepID=A0A9W9BPW0_9HYPO|nr:hypothetical protein N0V84_005043 [Fusarium piperis]
MDDNHCQALDTKQYEQAYCGRVIGIGKWRRSDIENFPDFGDDGTAPCTQQAAHWTDLGKIEALDADAIQPWIDKAPTIAPPRDERIPIDAWHGYDFGEEHADPSPSKPPNRKGRGKEKIAFGKYPQTSPMYPPESKVICRFTIQDFDDDEEGLQLMLLIHCHPLPANLENQTCRRKIFTDMDHAFAK